MIKPSHRHEFEQLTVFGVRRLIQANMYDDAKLKRAVKWLREQLHEKEKQENCARRGCFRGDEGL